ncbi:putative Rab-GTPase-TBC domain containing protein [Blattamonas nauphoetae]|uniref:Rab-GTPase-TBC domain containing protein n=1 Tax=Blattamonas nauphoetae TaxID=2049346 RepID=A0ABQ9YEQ9_9EUKA|nr:putative Rab-GTPase-TBC domain containing protein [Blattamonas nauphoetae]
MTPDSNSDPLLPILDDIDRDAESMDGSLDNSILWDFSLIRSNVSLGTFPSELRPNVWAALLARHALHTYPFYQKQPPTFVETLLDLESMEALQNSTIISSALSEIAIPPDQHQMIESDLHRARGTDGAPFSTNEQLNSLRSLISIYLCSHPRSHYIQGMHEIAAMIVLLFEYRTNDLAFAIFSLILDTIMNNMFSPDLSSTSTVQHYFSTLLSKYHPELGAHLDNLPVPSGSYVLQWLYTGFASLTFPLLLRLWDNIISSGFLFVVAFGVNVFRTETSLDGSGLSLSDKLFSTSDPSTALKYIKTAFSFKEVSVLEVLLGETRELVTDIEANARMSFSAWESSQQLRKAHRMENSLMHRNDFNILQLRVNHRNDHLTEETPTIQNTILAGWKDLESAGDLEGVESKWVEVVLCKLSHSDDVMKGIEPTQRPNLETQTAIRETKQKEREKKREDERRRREEERARVEEERLRREREAKRPSLISSIIDIGFQIVAAVFSLFSR